MRFLFKLYLYILGVFRAKIVRKVQRWYWTNRAMATCGSYKSKPIVNYETKLSKNTHLGNNVSFNGMIIKGGGKVIIGDNFHSGQVCKIINTFHDYESTKIPYDSTSIHKDVIIEDNVWLGDNVIILGGAHIGEGAIIQAGSVVVGIIPPCAIAGGQPAKPFKYRNEEHYYQLKAEGKFH